MMLLLLLVAVSRGKRGNFVVFRNGRPCVVGRSPHGGSRGARAQPAESILVMRAHVTLHVLWCLLHLKLLLVREPLLLLVLVYCSIIRKMVWAVIRHGIRAKTREREIQSGERGAREGSRHEAGFIQCASARVTPRPGDGNGTDRQSE